MRTEILFTQNPKLNKDQRGRKGEKGPSASQGHSSQKEVSRVLGAKQGRARRRWGKWTTWKPGDVLDVGASHGQKPATLGCW